MKNILFLVAPQDSHLPSVGRLLIPRPNMCHTSSLQTPNDKEQTLSVSVSVPLSPPVSEPSYSPWPSPSHA